MRTAKIIPLLLVVALYFTSSASAAYLTDITTATRPGSVDQSDSNPISGTGWADVSATRTDDSSLQRMFYSNAPESLPTVGGTYYKEGIIYNSAFRSNGGRAFVHHANTSTNKTVQIAVIARNVGASSGSVTIGKYGDGDGVPASDYIKLGAESVRQYFTNSALGTSYSMAVNEFKTLVTKTLSPGQAVSLNFDLSYSGTFRLYVAYITQDSTYTTPLSFLQANYNFASAYPTAVIDENLARGDAILERTINVTYNPDGKLLRRQRVNCCAPGQTHTNDTKIVAQDYTWNTSSPVNRTINGNFGLKYKIRVNTGTWNGTTSKLFVGLNPRGGPFQGGFWASEDIPKLAGGYAIPYLANNNRTGIMGRWGNSYRTVQVDYILPGAMNGPNVIVFTGF